MRVHVIGSSGAGKSTMARRLAEATGSPHLELDAVWHEPGWTNPTEDAAADAVRDFLATHPDRWVTDGNYRFARELLLASATDLVWIDLPRHVVMRQIVPRTLRRVVTRQELWNGNREPLSNLTRWDPERNVMRWAWTTFDRRRREYTELVARPDLAHLRIHHLRTRTDVDRFVADL